MREEAKAIPPLLVEGRGILAEYLMKKPPALN
jgi:hypothetical protein